jgi:hypothetical protein
LQTSPLFSGELPEISISPDRHGSGATRIEADLSINRGEKLMRRASTCLALLGCLAALGLPAAASADEPVAKIKSFKAVAVPIPKPGGGTYPHTGNILGAGAAVEAEYQFEGSGYGATPQNPAGGIPPISGVNFYLPGGSKLHPQGFGQCSVATLTNIGPKGCPKSSVASPVGSALGEVTFGNERVSEATTLQAFFGPGGGLLFYTVGTSPVSLEIISSGHYVTAKPPYGPELVTLVPPVASVPGAPLASVKTIKIKAGAAIKKGKKVISYGTLPKKCPKGGFPVKTEVIFGGQYGGEREFGIPAKTAEATFKAPCPKK